MSAKILSGKEMAAELELQQADKCAELSKNGIHPCLTVILVGDDPASAIYVRNKERACARIGIESRTVRMPAETTQDELIEQIDALNADNSVHGILIQLPLPRSCVCVQKRMWTGSMYITADACFRTIPRFCPARLGESCIC